MGAGLPRFTRPELYAKEGRRLLPTGRTPPKAMADGAQAGLAMTDRKMKRCMY